MIDPITLIAIITGIGGLIVSILTHIKHSSCFGVEIDTRTPQPSTPIPNTPMPINIEV